MKTPLKIDRLTLGVPGLTADEGRRLARMVGEHLAGAGRPDAPLRGWTGPLRIEVEAAHGGDLDRLSQAIATGVLRGIYG